ncbi:MAG: alpha-N-acetylglucosaminidase TIM-barrel domain-containing protein [Candidatus Cryptobacteroides sp.]
MRKFLATVSFLAVLLSFGCSSGESRLMVRGSADAIERMFGHIDNLEIGYMEPSGPSDRYLVEARDGRLSVRGSSPSAVCYAFGKYLREACGTMLTWGGSNLNIPEVWPDYREECTSPYELRYFLNVCTFGYTTPYWGWDRWEKELDWMALHGVNMALAGVAGEAVARRVWTRLGLTEGEADSFFTGPAYLPWHRMGNLNSYDGPLDEGWHNAQTALQHRILDRMRELGIEPVAPAFAGFVPPAFMEKYPDSQARQLEWGGFPKECNACVLAPDSPYFTTIGRMFVEEWEKEFGKAKYWLSDSFNEMRLPVSDEDEKHSLLAQYGKTICNSILAGDPDAVWVTQGWTFGYQHDFWDKESLKALLSEVPDDRLIIVDLGNDYPKWVWNTEQTWKVHEGFYGKPWIYSYVPNFGGKVLPTGDLDMYACGSVGALDSPFGATLCGFGSAPEGLENNEVVYELLSDMGWRDTPADLDKWLESYCLARYGYCGPDMLEAWSLFRESVWSSLRSYPRFTWQTVVPDRRRVSRHGIDERFLKGVELFLGCRDKCSGSELYRNDAMEFTALWLGEAADRHYEKALDAPSSVALKELAEAEGLLMMADSLLASHPCHNLSHWVADARNASEASGDSAMTADRCEADAKRLITTWGGFQEDYAARFWSGLIKDYYIPRMRLHFSSSPEALDEWEERWVMTPWTCSSAGYADPVERAAEIIMGYDGI